MKNLFVLLLFVLFNTSFPQSITLRDTTNQYDYIIITIPEFAEACEAFKQHKESYNNFNVLIVDTGQIYYEFNTDSLPQNNIREFISYAGTYWRSPKLKFVLLVGNINAVPGFHIQYIFPTYNPYHVSDYPYSISIFEQDTLTSEFIVGRLPAISTVELNRYFNKVIWYENNNQHFNWMNTNLFVCEYDGQFDFGEGNLRIANKLPSNFYKKFYEDNDTSQYFGNVDSVMSFINTNGASIVWFSGRTKDSIFITPRPFLVTSDVSKLTNSEKYFVSMFYSQGAVLDTNTNIAKEMLFKENSGSIGSIQSTGYTLWPTIVSFQESWVGRIYSSENLSIAEAMSDTLLISQSHYLKTAINFWGDPSLKLKYSAVVDADNSQSLLPSGFALMQNYPNPFNPSTKIKWQSPVSGHQTLKVYDVLGNEVATLVNEYREAGNYEINYDASGLASGIYLYKLQAGSFISTKKMIYLK